MPLLRADLGFLALGPRAPELLLHPNLSVRVAGAGLSILVSIPQERTVELVVDGEPGAPLRLRPRLPLEPGEYAFVSQSNLNTLNAVRMFDFGMD